MTGRRRARPSWGGPLGLVRLVGRALVGALVLAWASAVAASLASAGSVALAFVAVLSGVFVALVLLGS